MTAQRLPNLVIAGTVKGGTTSLWTYLAQHPEVCCSSVKETCYFSIHRYGDWDSRYQNATDPFEQFRSYFCHCQQQKYVMEATPGYFLGGADLAQSIKKTLGDQTKVIVVFRNPVDRLISFWKYKKSMLELDSDLTLEDYLEQCEAASEAELLDPDNARYCGIVGGRYADYMDDWFEAFGDGLNVLFFDDLKADTRGLLTKISDWLEIDDSFFDSIDLGVQNKSVGYKNAGFQKLALWVNSKAEKFWRANQGLKNVLRETYYAINGQPHQTQVSEATRNQIESLYAPYNQRLAVQLSARGYQQLPDWLAKHL